MPFQHHHHRHQQKCDYQFTLGGGAALTMEQVIASHATSIHLTLASFLARPLCYLWEKAFTCLVSPVPSLHVVFVVVLPCSSPRQHQCWTRNRQLSMQKIRNRIHRGLGRCIIKVSERSQSISICSTVVAIVLPHRRWGRVEWARTYSGARAKQW